MAEYKPSYMEEEEDQNQASNPLASQQNTLNQQAAPGSSVPTSTQTSAQSAPTSTSAESANVGVSSGQAATATPSTQNKKASGMFTNIQKYIRANQGADLAGSIQRNLGQQTQKVGQQLGERSAQATSQLEQQRQERQRLFGKDDVSDRFRFGLSESGRALQQAGQLGDVQNPNEPKQTTGIENIQQPGIAQESEAWNTLTKNTNVDKTPLTLEQQEQTLTQARDFAYQGPQEFKTSDLEKQRQDLTGLAKASTTEGGRFGLLQKMFGKEGYTTGQQRLDNLLLQGDEQAKSKLSEARKDIRGVSAQLDKTAADVRSQMAQEQAKTKQDVANFAEQLGTTSVALTNDLQDRIANVNAELAQDMANMSQEEKESVLSKLGFGRNPRTGEFIIGDLSSVSVPELSNIFEEVKNDASIANFDEYALARANMLQRLRGQSELGQFDESAQPFGIERGLKEGYRELADLAPSQEAGMLSSPQRIGIDDSFARQLAENSSAVTLDNLRWDTKDIKQDLYRDPNKVYSSGSFKALTPEQQNHYSSQIEQAKQELKEFSDSLPYGWSGGSMRNTYGPQLRSLQAKVLGKISDMVDAAKANADKAATIYANQNRAQTQAIANMAKYLRNSDIENREAFDKNWSALGVRNRASYY